MNEEKISTDFAKNLTLLRKERKISQKQAAADLGVSQALLSHYEKGVRECGLKFLVKAAEYYDVSCDELLGRGISGGADSAENCSADLIKRSLSGSVNVLLAAAKKCGKKTEKAAASCLMLTVYRLMRLIGMSVNSEISQAVSEKLAQAAISLNEADIAAEACTEAESAPEIFINQCEKLIFETISDR